MYFRDSINRPRVEEVQPDDGLHLHLHTADELGSGSACEDLLDRVNNLEEAVARIVDQEDDQGEDPLPDDTTDYDDAVVVRRRPISTLPREQWSDANRRTADQGDDDVGTTAKNRGVPSSPKTDVPESKLPDIAEINRRNTAYWAGASVNKHTGPNSTGSVDVDKRLSDTPKQLNPGRTFGVTADAVARGQFYKGQTARQAKLVQTIQAKNDAFYKRLGSSK